MTAIAYTTPEIPLILAVSSFLYLISVAEAVFARFIHAGLLGPLCIGILYGSEVSGILPDALQSTCITLGYIGLLLIVFEAGLSTNISLLFDNILLSCAVAVSGMALPVALSMLLLHFGYRYSPLQAFAAGAALSSTSLGTTLTVLKPAYRGTRTGTVLMAAALLDDIGGLVIAAILAQLSAYGATAIPWYVVARPILVSFGFAVGVPVLAVASRWVLRRGVGAGLRAPGAQLFVVVATLAGFVAGAKYAGTSELFGAYLAGAYLTYVFSAPTDAPAPIRAFQDHIAPLVQSLLAPLFFASIGSALPIRSLGAVDGSHRVVWRGLIYALLMGAAKALVGLWMLVWPDRGAGRGWFGRRVARGTRDEDGDVTPPTAPAPDFTPTRSALLVGLAMIARGEIALMVAEIARPLLGIAAPGDAAEPFAVVMWATLLNTAGGAILVGVLLRERKSRVDD
ncbi:Cation/H+ exchanger [Mycena rosella]|uniref:Cation/H+ exchanger n=1 Tax=Mycena rosella TaxID=1033263 RepID=A0AAD7GR54_MYCRO|nr:Cation/H+ exchanger [Mycena rosella]